MSNQFFEQQLEKFKKSNKTRRAKIALEAGYSSPEEYIEFLESCILPTEIKAERSKPTILVVDVVDRSGSMQGSKIKAANEGVKRGIESLKTDQEAYYLHSLIHFGSDVKIEYDPIAIDNVEFSTIKINGMTALHDAIGNAINNSISNSGENEKILINIYTDGGENSSIVYKASYISQLINLYKDRVTVTFIGTERDVNIAKSMYNLGDGNTLVYDGSAKGLGKSIANTISSRQEYTAKVKRGEDVSTGFYKTITKK